MKKFSDQLVNEVTSFDAHYVEHNHKDDLKEFSKLVEKKPNDLKRTVDKKYNELSVLYTKLNSAKLITPKLFDEYLEWLNQYFRYTTPLTWFQMEKVTEMKDWEQRKLTTEKEDSVKKLANASKLPCPAESVLSSYGNLKSQVYLFNKSIDLRLLDSNAGTKNYIHLKSLPQFCRLIYSDHKLEKVTKKSRLFEGLIVYQLQLASDFNFYVITQSEKLVQLSSTNYGYNQIATIQKPFDLIITFNQDLNGDSMLIPNKKYFISEPLIV